MDQRTEKDVVMAAQGGCVESLGLLYERYYKSMVWLAYSVVFDRDLAQDVVQETFTTVCRTMGTLRRPERFGAWLSQICRNRAVDSLRKQVANSVPLREDIQVAEQETREQDLVVRQAIADLPQMYREIVVLFYFHQRSYEELQQILGISLHAVKGRLHRSRKQIAQILTDRGFNDWGCT